LQFTTTGSGIIADSATPLHAGWQLLGSEPGAYQHPEQLPAASQDWQEAVVPGTVAQALAQAGRWSLREQMDFDARDWWYQCRFQVDSDLPQVLHFQGLATLAEVWLNGESVLNSENMFLARRIEVGKLPRDNTLVICFRALNPVLAQRRARPRWKTKLVQQQQLRWIRSTLLGRIPGWSPPVAPVGPWRGILLEPQTPYAIRDLQLRPGFQDHQGLLQVDGRLELPDSSIATQASLYLDDQVFALQIEPQGQSVRFHAELKLAGVKPWWPHTHGEPAHYACRLEFECGGQKLNLACGDLGFRKLEADTRENGFRLVLNDTPIFCRGACWTVNDIVSINGDPVELERCLQLARDAGVNMLRVGGTMVYEQDAFYQLCDRLGILVWQDFMFANMDYPVEDAGFAESVQREVTQQLQGWQSHPCIAVYCGNSEVEQQAAMLGIDREHWRSPLFAQHIPELCAQWHPDVPYVPSTPSGGTLPFHVASGITHYYGVGAYLRPPTDVRLADVRFTPECLGFSNIPEDGTLNKLFDGQLPVCHHPLWKSRVPRDSGAGWDFEDVRDHYTKELFGLDPVALRSFDMPRYLALGRITTGELMARVYAEWRSTHSRCGGGLVWFFKDLWPGAGWGILDSTGLPKACYRYLQRAWQAQTVLLTDEGLDGVHLHLINEKPEALRGRVELLLLRGGRVTIAKAEREVELAPRSMLTLESDELLNGFYDVAYAYRFGPPKHDVVAASLFDDGGECLAEAVFFAGNRKTETQSQVNLIAEAQLQDNGEVILELECDVLLQAVHFDIKGYTASEEYFHLLPGRRKRICLRSNGETVSRFRGYVESISLEEAVGIVVSSDE